MLVDEIKKLMTVEAIEHGSITKARAIQEIKEAAGLGKEFIWFNHSLSDKLVKYFIEEGFTVEITNKSLWFKETEFTWQSHKISWPD